MDRFKNRKLVHLEGRRLLFDDHYSSDDHVENTYTINEADIESTLPEIVMKITKPLYQSFDFFDPPLDMFVEVSNKLKTVK